VVDGAGFPDTMTRMQTRKLVVLAVTGLVGCAPAAVDKHPPPAAPEAPPHAPPVARAPETETPAPGQAGLEARLEQWVFEGHPQDLSRKASLFDAWTLSRIFARLERWASDDHARDPVPWWQDDDLEHPQVERWKKTFRTSSYERSLQSWIEDASPYAPHVRKILEEEGLPPELWVLTLLESGFRPEARSTSAAVGPWQFLAATARHTGLLVSADRDQRRDWEEATRAACRYLNELRDEFGNDGLLALAAFNCGPARVHRAMTESRKRNFWSLDLPQETERYVPRALALASLVGDGDSDHYHLDPDDALTYDTVTLPHPVSVESLARVCETTPAELRRLNPSWLRSVTPGDGHPVDARVPEGKRKAVRNALEDGGLPKPAPVKPALASQHRVHHVTPGETLWGIAHRYGTKLDALRRANGLSASSVIHPGQKLRIPG
jgi:peptidoglycan lytic transglycosylase D